MANSDDFQREVVRFYSSKMLMLHVQLLGDDGDSIEALQMRFMETHEFESLTKFVHREKGKDLQAQKLKMVKRIKKLSKKLKSLDVVSFELDPENDSREAQKLKKELREVKLGLLKSNVSRSVVLTNSLAKKTVFADLGEVSFGITEIDQNGTAWLEEKLAAFLDKGEDAKLFVIEFNDARQADQIEYVKKVVDNIIEAHYDMNKRFGKQEAPGARAEKLKAPVIIDKEIVIVFFKPLIFEITADTRIADAEYFDDDWQYRVIDDLEGSCYHQNMQFLTQSSEEIFIKIRSGGCADLLTKLFIESVKDMEVRANFEGHLKNHILPTFDRQIELLNQNESSKISLEQELVKLSRLDEGGAQTARIKMVRILGKKVFSEIDTKRIADWRDVVFADQAVFENVSSIQETVISICRNEFMRKLKHVFKHLVHGFGVSSLLTLQNLPRDSAESLEALFVETLETFLGENK